MLYTSEALQQLIEELSQLPGVGRKSAQRIALYILKLPREEVNRMARSLIDVKDRIRYCSSCSNITEQDPCVIPTTS
jgi:recombination protein RecR